MKYKECFEILGNDRNSYSKTDMESTFMRMKEDHMLHGQLKPTYNVQIAVENYFIIHSHISNDRTDYNTLIPVLEKHKRAFEYVPEEVTADSGYCSEKNLLYLRNNHICGYMKLQDHEQRKTRAYSNDISKYYNMKFQIDEDESYYICHDGRELHHIRTETKQQKGYVQTYEVYGCEDCSECEIFHYRTSEKVYKEIMLYVIGRNMNKYHRFLHGKIQKFEGKEEHKTA